MAQFTTAGDLKTDALRMAGELDNGNSPFDSRLLDMLTSVQRTLVVGGTLGPLLMPDFDWWWARARPRGQLTLIGASNTDQATEATITQGSPTVTLDYGITTDMSNWRMEIADVGYRPTIRSNADTIITLASNFVEYMEEAATRDWIAYKTDYALADDCVRITSPVFLSVWPYRLDLVDATTLEQVYPSASVGEGTPTMCAIVASNVLRFSHYPDRPLAAEYEYIARPAVLTATTDIPAIPVDHARVLSVGAATWIAWEKADARFETLLQQYRAGLSAMKADHMRMLQQTSAQFGMTMPRDLMRRGSTGTGTFTGGGFGGTYGA